MNTLKNIKCHDEKFFETVIIFNDSLQVNHFPGSGYITNKVNLATSGLPHVPVAFKIPEQKAELIEYVMEK